MSSEDEKSTIKNPNDSWQLGDFMTFFPQEISPSLQSKKDTDRIGARQGLIDNDVIEVVKGDDSPLESNEETGDAFKKATKLKLKVISALSIEIGTEILIDAKGLVNEKKAEKSGKVYFGTQSTEDASANYLIPKVERGIGGVHCLIQFNAKKNFYQIKDLGNGCGTFIKITGKVPLKTGHHIFFGEIHFQITITDKELIIQFLTGPKASSIL